MDHTYSPARAGTATSKGRGAGVPHPKSPLAELGTIEASGKLNDAVRRINVEFLTAIAEAARDCPNHLRSVIGVNYSEADIETFTRLTPAKISDLSVVAMPTVILRADVIRRFDGDQDHIQLMSSLQSQARERG